MCVMIDNFFRLKLSELGSSITIINLQAFLEHGIPRSPEMVVALMQKASSDSSCLMEIFSKLFSLK